MATRRKRPKTPLQKFKESVRRFKGRPIILAEGDSWFAFPTRKNIVDHVRKMGKFSLLSMASNGGEAIEMLGNKQKKRMRSRLTKFDIQALLFSAGGNDVVGEGMISLLRPVSNPKDWEGCLRKEPFQRKLRMVRGAYEELIDLRNEHRKSCTIITHGYDFPHPSDVGAKVAGVRTSGPWMKPYMDEKGLTDAKAQRQLAVFLLSGLNDLLAALAKKTPKFIYLNTTGTLKKEEWGDEIHPTTSGFGKIAAHFKGALQQTFPGYPIS